MGWCVCVYSMCVCVCVCVCAYVCMYLCVHVLVAPYIHTYIIHSLHNTISSLHPSCSANTYVYVCIICQHLSSYQVSSYFVR